MNQLHLDDQRHLWMGGVDMGSIGPPPADRSGDGDLEAWIVRARNSCIKHLVNEFQGPMMPNGHRLPRPASVECAYAVPDASNAGVCAETIRDGMAAIGHPFRVHTTWDPVREASVVRMTMARANSQHPIALGEAP